MKQANRKNMKTTAKKDANGNKKKKRDEVWVLVIKDGDCVYPEVHKTFEGCLNGAKKDLKTHKVGSWREIKKHLENEMYWRDAFWNISYEINPYIVFD